MAHDAFGIHPLCHCPVILLSAKTQLEESRAEQSKPLGLGRVTWSRYCLQQPPLPASCSF